MSKKAIRKSLEYRTRAIAAMVAELRKNLPPGAQTVEVHIKFADGGSVKVEGKA